MKFFSLLIFILIYYDTLCKKETSQNGVTYADTIENFPTLISNAQFPQCTLENICNACQNSLYYLKIHGKLDCRYTQCADKCLSLTHDFYQNINPHIKMYRNNQISACQTCFRLNLCHISICDKQEKIILNAIDKSLLLTPQFHRIKMINPRKINLLNKETEDYFFNMNLVMKNMQRVLSDANSYYELMMHSDRLKKIYSILYKKVSRKEFNTGKDSQIREKIFSTNKEEDKLLLRLQYQQDLNSFSKFWQTFHSQLEKKKVKLYTDKIYDSSEILKDEQIYKQYDDLDDKIKSLLTSVVDMTDRMKEEIEQNIIFIENLKYEIYAYKGGSNNNLSIKQQILSNKNNKIFNNKIRAGSKNNNKIYKSNERLKTNISKNSKKNKLNNYLSNSDISGLSEPNLNYKINSDEEEDEDLSNINEDKFVTNQKMDLNLNKKNKKFEKLGKEKDTYKNSDIETESNEEDYVNTDDSEDSNVEDEIDAKIKKIKRLSKHPSTKNPEISVEPSIIQGNILQHKMEIFSKKPKNLIKNLRKQGKDETFNKDKHQEENETPKVDKLQDEKKENPKEDKLHDEKKENPKEDKLHDEKKETPNENPKQNSTETIKHQVNNTIDENSDLDKQIEEKLNLLNKKFDFLKNETNNSFISSLNTSSYIHDQDNPLQLIPNENLNSETKIPNAETKDIDSLLDRRELLMKKFSLNNNKEDNYIKKLIEKDIEEANISSINKMFKKTLSAVRHLKKKINRLEKKECKEKNPKMNTTENNHANYENNENLNSTVSSLNISSSLLNDTDISNSSQYHFDIPIDSPIKFIPSQNNKVKMIVDFNPPAVNQEQEKHLERDSKISLDKDEDVIKILRSLQNMSGKKEDGILLGDEDEKSDKSVKIDKIDKNEKEDNKRKKSMFPLLFLEKSVKSLDDELYYITQNLYPDLTFY